METKKQLIIIADDYGYSDERDEGIHQCYKTGGITGVSLMVNGYSAERAVKSALIVGLPLDLHLNLSEGRPISNATQSFTDKDGFMLGKMGFREAVSNGLVNLKEIRVETQAQIDRFQSLTGFKPVKVDGHQHVHIIPGVCEVFAQTLTANQIHLTRLPLENGINSHQWSSAAKAEFMKEVIMQSYTAGTVFRKHGIKYPHFVGLKTMGQDMNMHHLQSCINDAFDKEIQHQLFSNTTLCTSRNLTLISEGQTSNSTSQGKTGSEGSVTDENICELMVHPGKITGSIGGCGNGPDGFSQSHDREHEMEILLSSEMLSFYMQNNISLIPFASLNVAKS